MSQFQWHKKFEDEKDGIEEVASEPVDRDSLLENLLLTCRQKRDTLLEYHLFLNELEGLKLKGEQPSENVLNRLQNMSDKVYNANREFFLALDEVDGTDCWAVMRKMMDGLDK